MRKYLLGVAMALCALLALIPPGASAAPDSGDAFLSGAHELRTPEDVVAIAVDMSGSYALMNDIDLTPLGEWTPINGDFSGTLDGQGHSITGMKSVKSTSYGLFKSINGGSVRNLHMGVSFSEYGKLGSGGAIASHITNAVIENCSVSGAVSTDNGTIGGLVGSCESSSVSNCYSNALMRSKYAGPSGEYRYSYGGIAGKADDSTTFENCYYAGRAQSYQVRLQGIASGGSQEQCHYSYENYSLQNGKTTHDGESEILMKLQANYVGWDFEDVWAIDPDINDGYPYLRCEAKPNRNRFTITFNPNGGEVSPASKTLTKDDAIYGELPTPTREGYAFQGWHTATEDGTRIKSSTKFDRTDNQTLYAVWSKTTQNYTVQFEGNGGDVSPSSKTVAQGEPYGELPTPSRANFAFKGWFAEASGGTQVTEETTVNLSDNQILYAQWKKDAITYSVEDGGGASSVTDVSQLAPGSELTLELEQEEPSGNFQTASVFCAVYDRQGGMVHLQVWEADLSDTLNVAMLGKIKIPEKVEVGEIRVFLLSENLVPLRAADILD